MFPDDDSALGPFLGNLPPEILDDVVEKLGGFRMTFAMAGKTCREVVERLPSSRALLATARQVLTKQEIKRMMSRGMTPLAVAVMEGDVEALEWLIKLFDGKDLEWRDDGAELSRMAAVRGKIESLTCLRANQCPWDWMTCSAAARGGHLGVLQWLNENGCRWNPGTCEAAAWGGHLEMLQWARQNGFPWNVKTCINAAYRGHLQVLQWAHQNGCPWSEETCQYAAWEGHLEVLRWARQNGCPWDAKTWSWAHPRCRPYLLEHGCPGADESRAYEK
jgi:hypothetical protein